MNTSFWNYVVSFGFPKSIESKKSWVIINNNGNNLTINKRKYFETCTTLANSLASKFSKIVGNKLPEIPSNNLVFLSKISVFFIVKFELSKLFPKTSKYLLIKIVK